MDTQYKPCPFCKGEIHKCGTDPSKPEDQHECHFLECRTCRVQFDVLVDQNPEELEDLQAIIQKRWNSL